MLLLTLNLAPNIGLKIVWHCLEPVVLLSVSHYEEQPSSPTRGTRPVVTWWRYSCWKALWLSRISEQGSLYMLMSRFGLEQHSTEIDEQSLGRTATLCGPSGELARSSLVGNNAEKQTTSCCLSLLPKDLPLEFWRSISNRMKHGVTSLHSFTLSLCNRLN